MKSMEIAYTIRVLDKEGKWYDNALIENPYDALMVAKYYKEEMGYSIKLIDPRGKDVTQVIDNTHVVTVKRGE